LIVTAKNQLLPAIMARKVYTRLQEEIIAHNTIRQAADAEGPTGKILRRAYPALEYHGEAMIRFSGMNHPPWLPWINKKKAFEQLCWYLAHEGACWTWE